MAQGKLQLHVLCSSTAMAQAWQARRDAHDDLDVDPIVSSCAIDTIRQLAAVAQQPFLVCAESIWVGLGISDQVERLVDELDRRFPNWGLCGNRGMRWDGQHVFDYSYDMSSGGLQTSLCAHPVLSLDDRLLLVNPKVVNRHKIPAPSIRNSRPGVLLSLECLQNRSLMAVSPRLLAMRNGTQELEEEQALDAEPAFRKYYRASFLNHHFPTPDGVLQLGEIIDYQYISEPWSSSPQEDVLQLYDESLAASRAVLRPSITICCRTQFRRGEMLERAVLSFAAFRQHSSSLADVKVRLITDVSGEGCTDEVRRLQQAYPGAALECWQHQIRPYRFSRTDLLLAAIERADTDYIWFIDDDDFANAAAAPALARSLVCGQPMVIVASAAQIQEKWREADRTEGVTGNPDRPRLELTSAIRSSSYSAIHVFRILKGLNFVPICGTIFPVGLMQQRISKARALGDYNEDYFLLLLALTAPRVEVSLLDCELSSVSIRGEENTVTQKDRSGWHLALATFLLEVINNDDGNSPFLWQLGNSPRW